MCVAVVTDPHNGNVSEMSSTSDALNFRQLGESTGVLEMECIDELDFPRSAAASKKKMHAADKLDRRASAMSVAEKDGSEDFSGTLEENLQTGSGRQPNAKEASMFDLRSDHFVGYSQQNCALRGRRSMGLFADLMHTNKLFSPPSSKDDNHRRKWRAEKEKSRTVEGVSLAASCMNEGHNEYSDQRLTQRSNPYGSPVTSDLDDGGYATWNFEMPLASGGENDSNRNLNLVLPHRAVLSKHKLTGNFPTCSDPVTQCASEELNGGASRPVIFDVLTLSATEEGNALLKEISFFYESKKPIYNSDNCHVEDADALVESRERSGIVAEEHGISSRASPLMTNFTPKVEEESTESVRTARVRNERCLSNRAASNMFVTAADASNATIFIDRMHQFLVHQMAQMWDEFLTEGEPPTSYSTTANCTSDEATTLRYNHDIANDLNDDDREPPHGSY
uniref:Uncharacterized protein n=1 Tax=Parascaris univalens TaxID=6257 RepID=A0A915A5J9_PARUN